MRKLFGWIFLMGLLSLIFGCGNDSGYHKKSGRWYYGDTPVSMESEPVNFEPLGKYFARDERVAYYRGIPIDDGRSPSDGPSFQVVSDYYAKDKFRVYYCDTERDSKEYWTIKRSKTWVLGDADPATFQLLGDGYTARDKSKVYSKFRAITVRDVATYETLEDGFAKDKVRGYYREGEIPDSDGASFQVLDHYYARDKFRIYYVEGFAVGGPVAAARLDSFRVLENGYATDGARAYYRGKKITSKNADTLQALAGMGYAKTLDEVFHDGELMKDADAASFALVDKFSAEYDAFDKLGRFQSGVRVKASP